MRSVSLAVCRQHANSTEKSHHHDESTKLLHGPVCQKVKERCFGQNEQYMISIHIFALKFVFLKTVIVFKETRFITSDCSLFYLYGTSGWSLYLGQFG